MQSIKIKCPAKINLDLKIKGKRLDGFHEISSVMQTISLYDYLTISVEPAKELEINLTGTCSQIPYDSSNLVYKAAKLYFESINISNKKVDIFIEKNIPIAAGLAGGSSDAAGTFFGLNIIFENKLSEKKLHELCAKLGSDLNFCLIGGRAMTSGRGEVITPEPFESFSVNLIKPNNLGISAKEAYCAFAEKIKNKDFEKTRKFFKNDLEWAIIDKYPELELIKKAYPTSMMTGSGSTYFSLEEKFVPQENFWVKNDLHAIEHGISIADK